MWWESQFPLAVVDLKKYFNEFIAHFLGGIFFSRFEEKNNVIESQFSWLKYNNFISMRVPF